MSTSRVIALFLLALIGFSACGEVKSPRQVSTQARAGGTHISSQQLASDISGRESFLLLDIRTEAEFQAGHIKGAKWMPRGTLEFSIQELTTDPGARIILYCRSGGRSALAVASLKAIGYNSVVDLEGGFEAWLTEGNTFYNLHGEHRVVSFEKEE